MRIGLFLLVCAAAGAAEAYGEELYVSTDAFGGAMIVEIVVTGADPGAGEPAVTLDGADLRMIRGTDGNWYAYVADTHNVRVIDGATGIGGTGLDFGIECGPGFLGGSFDPAAAVFTSGRTCEQSASPGFLHVLNGAGRASGTVGGVPFDTDHWPLIQTFEMGGEVVIGHASGQRTLLFGGGQADLDVEGGPYPRGSDVRLIIRDMLLNIDPTNEDAWTFDIGSGEVYSCIFDRAGRITDTNGTVVEVDPGLIYHYGGALGDAGFGGSGVLEVSPPGALYTVDNALQDSTLLPSIAGSLLTVRETEPNSGIFSNTGRLGAANLRAGADFGIAYGGSGTAGSVAPGPERPGVSVSGLRVEAGSDGQMTISAEASSYLGEAHEFAYFVDVFDEEGLPGYVAHTEGSIAPGQTVQLEVQWTPDGPGEYAVAAYVMWPGGQSLAAEAAVTVG